MPTRLTLSQVRESQLFAWHPAGYLYVNGELFRALRMEPPASDGYSRALRVRRSSLTGGEHLVEDGWYHAEGCSCRFCTAPQTEPELPGASHAAV
jgi:hypothetical protein